MTGPVATVNLKFTGLNPEVKPNVFTPGFSWAKISTPEPGRPSTTPLGQPWHWSLVCSTGWRTVEQGWTMFSRADCWCTTKHERRSGVDDFIAGHRQTHTGCCSPRLGALRWHSAPAYPTPHSTYSCSSFLQQCHCCTANIIVWTGMWGRHSK